MPAENFGRIHHLPAAQLAAVIDGLRDRGLIGDDGWLSEPGRAVKQRVEALTDDLAAKPYESLEPASSMSSWPRWNARHATTRRPRLVDAAATVLLATSSAAGGLTSTFSVRPQGSNPEPAD